MSVRYAEEGFEETAREARPLIQAHAEEVGLTEMPLPFDPAWEMYNTLEQAGMMRWYTMRDGKGVGGEMLGYALWFLTPALVFAGVMMAANEAIYIRPGQRYHAAAFMRFCELELRRAGARMLTYTMWDDRQSARLLERAGFTKRQATWWKH